MSCVVVLFIMLLVAVTSVERPFNKPKVIKKVQENLCRSKPAARKDIRHLSLILQTQRLKEEF